MLSNRKFDLIVDEYYKNPTDYLKKLAFDLHKKSKISYMHINSVAFECPNCVQDMTNNCACEYVDKMNLFYDIMNGH